MRIKDYDKLRKLGWALVIDGRIVTRAQTKNALLAHYRVRYAKTLRNEVVQVFYRNKFVYTIQ